MFSKKDISELLPEADVNFLNEKYPGAQVYQVGDEVHVLLPSFPFPNCYKPSTADLLIRLPAGYSDARPDMFWTMPDVKLATGAWPVASEHHEVPGSGSGSEIYKTPWQRWSRHTTDATWRAGIDGLRSFVGAIKSELDRNH